MTKVDLNEEAKTAVVHVPEDQLSLAIGRKGQNVRLASKLTGLRIDIAGSGARKGAEEEKTEVESEGEDDTDMKSGNESNAEPSVAEPAEVVSEATVENEEEKA